MEKILRIGGAAREAGVCAETVRNYEARKLLEIPRDDTGMRVFTTVEVERIKEIKRMYAQQDRKMRGEAVTT